MKERTCCFTGHRELPADTSKIEVLLEEQIRHLMDRGITDFCAGGALGFDTLAALTVLKLKREYKTLRLILVLPCPEQAQKWSAKDKAVYEDIKLRADEVIYSSDAYYKGCMQKRNRDMVDRSCCCICYMTKRKGGTRLTTDYCAQKGVHIINIASAL